MARRGTTGARAPGRNAEERPLVVYGANPVLELLRSRQPVSRLHLGPGSRRGELEAAARERGVRVETLDRSALDRTAGTPHHQGAVAVATPFRFTDLGELCAAPGRGLLVLDGIQDPRNLGAILRTARATGAGGVVLPRDRSARITSVTVAASAGLVFGLPVAQVPNLVRAMEGLKAAGLWLIGLIPRDGTAIDRVVLPGRPALVVGGEGEGLRPLVRRGCDLLTSIPMTPGVESLNVSVAVGVALYDFLVRRPAP